MSHSPVSSLQFPVRTSKFRITLRRDASHKMVGWWGRGECSDSINVGHVIGGFDISKYRTFGISKLRMRFALHPLVPPCFFADTERKLRCIKHLHRLYRCFFRVSISYRARFRYRDPISNTRGRAADETPRWPYVRTRYIRSVMPYIA